MANFYAIYPGGGGGGGGVPVYTNLAAFPSAVTAGNGALAIAGDTDILYISNGTVWEVLADPTIGPFAITALHGDGTATGPGDVALTLATVNSNVGTFGSAANVAQVTVNAKGLTTAASNVAIQIAESQVTNLVTDLAGKVPTSRVINTTAPITGGGDLSADRTIAMPAATGSVNGYLTSADWNTFNNKEPAITTLPVTKGGTGTSTQFTQGSIVFAGASGVYTQDNAHLFYDNANDRLGVGTATPSFDLDVQHDAGAAIISATGYGTANFGYHLARNARGTQASPTAVQLGDTLGGNYFSGYGATQFQASNNASTRIVGVAAQNWTDTAQGSDLHFYTTTFGTAGSTAGNRMRINSTGYVGIGVTTDPIASLEVRNASASSSVPQIVAASTSSVGNICVVNSTSGYNLGSDGFTFLLSGVDTYMWNREAGILSLGTSGIERMVILSGGAVGIGVNPPAAKLHVLIDDSATNTVTNVLRLDHTSSGTPAANFGTGILLTGESTTTAGQPQAAIRSYWTTATDASRTSSLDFQTVNNGGSLTSQMTINGAGNVAIGSTTFTSKFNIGASQEFQVNSTGNIVKLNNVTTNFPSSQGAATTILQNDGSGNLTWVANSAAAQATATVLGTVKGGTVPGTTTGTATAAGYVGEIIAASSITGLSFTTTETDIPNATVTLTAGIWELVYQFTVFLATGTAQGNTVTGTIKITDSSNVLVPTTGRVSFLNNSGSGAAAQIETIMSCSVIINISAGATYKIRGVAAASAAFSVITFADNDASFRQCVYYAKRIG